MSNIGTFNQDVNLEDSNPKKEKCDSEIVKITELSNKLKDKIYVKSMSALCVPKTFPENFQKRRRIFSINNGNRINRKKLHLKKLSEVNIRKSKSRMMLNENLLDVFKNNVANKGPRVSVPANNPEIYREEADQILKSFNNLKISDSLESMIVNPPSLENFVAENSSNFGFGDDFGNLVLPTAKPKIPSTKKKSVKWNHQVDVVYYAGDNAGQFLCHQKEPLQEELNQQIRRQKFVQLHRCELIRLA